MIAVTRSQENIVMASWETIAPLYNLWSIPDGVELPLVLDSRTSLCEVPAWLRDEQPQEYVDFIRPKFRELLRKNKNLRYCVRVCYVADALGSPDPEWKGQQPRAIQDAAVERVYQLLTGFWLTRPTSLYVKQIAHIAFDGEEALFRQVAEYDTFRVLPSHQDTPYTATEWGSATGLFENLTALSQNGTLRVATTATIRAIMEPEWTMRFMMFWLVLECLFGANDARETTYRLSQHVALFLESDPARAKELFRQVKDSYSWRSKVVHGLRLSKLTPERSDALIQEIERWARNSIERILTDESLTSAFDGSRREDFLQDLVFDVRRAPSTIGRA